jgi:hypothetical protein
MSFISWPPFIFHQVGVRSIECQALPGREARALRAKIMRRASLLGRGGQAVLFREQRYCLVGAAREARDWAPDGPASLCGGTDGSPGGVLFPPMLFARNALASRPQAGLCPGKRIAKVKGGKLSSAWYITCGPEVRSLPGFFKIIDNPFCRR